ncbi:MAG: putative glycoside hydrolase [bacterium]
MVMKKRFILLAILLLIAVVVGIVLVRGRGEGTAEETTNGETILPKKKTISDKGVYVTATMANLPVRFGRLRAGAKKSGINTLVIDVKEIIAKPLFELIKDKKLTPGTKAAADPWLKKLTKELHDEGFIVSARIVVIKDDHLVLARQDLGVKVAGGGLYRDLKGGKWADPYSDEVRLYNELIAETAALSGVDEVQFDYIRFPAEGGARNAVYPHIKEGVTRVDIICEFLRGVKERLTKYNTSIAVDIFGVTAWQSKNDIAALGQDLKRMAPYLDVISPMLYPSHFHAGYDGYGNPGSYPYYFMNAGVARAKEILSGEAVALVPWIQGFNLRSPNYGPNYILEQIKGCKDAEIERYLIWNARNDYSVSFNALGKP